MSIIHKPASSGTTNLQTLAADRAARALAVNDGLAESNTAKKHDHYFALPAVKVPVQEQSAPAPAQKPANVPVREVTEASVEAAIVSHREEEAPRPNMAPIIKTRVASVGAGSTRSVPHAPFVPNQPKPVKQSSVGGGQAKRPAPSDTGIPVSPAASPARPGVVTAESIAAAIAASRPAAPAASPAPRVMASKKK
jgi:hypothetical protein